MHFENFLSAVIPLEAETLNASTAFLKHFFKRWLWKILKNWKWPTFSCLINPPPFRKISVLIKGGGILFSQNFYTEKSLKRKNPKIEDGLIKGGRFYLRGGFYWATECTCPILSFWNNIEMFKTCFRLQNAFWKFSGCSKPSRSPNFKHLYSRF